MKKWLCTTLALCLILIPLFPPTVCMADDTHTVNGTDWTQVASPAEATVVGWSLRLTSDFALLFYIHAPKNCYSAGVTVNEERIGATYDKDSGLWVAAYRHISPERLTARCVAAPYYGGRNGVLTESDAITFSVADYAEYLLKRPDTDPSLRALLISLLNYGAAAQRFLSYYVNDPADRSLTAAERQPDTSRVFPTELIYGPESEEIGKIASVTAATLVIGRTVGFKIYVDIAGQEDLRINGGAGIDAYRDQLTPSEEAGMLAQHLYIEVSDTPDFQNAKRYPLKKCQGATDASSTSDAGLKMGYYALTDGLYGEELGTTFYIRLVRQSLGVTAPELSSGYMQYSVDLYAGRMLQQLQAQEDKNGMQTTGERRTEALLRALVAYGDAVTAYKAHLASLS